MILSPPERVGNVVLYMIPLHLSTFLFMYLTSQYKVTKIVYWLLCILLFIVSLASACHDGSGGIGY